MNDSESPRDPDPPSLADHADHADHAEIVASERPFHVPDDKQCPAKAIVTNQQLLDCALSEGHAGPHFDSDRSLSWGSNLESRKQ